MAHVLFNEIVKSNFFGSNAFKAYAGFFSKINQIQHLNCFLSLSSITRTWRSETRWSKCADVWQCSLLCCSFFKLVQLCTLEECNTRYSTTVDLFTLCNCTSSIKQYIKKLDITTNDNNTHNVNVSLKAIHSVRKGTILILQCVHKWRMHAKLLLKVE